MIQQRLTERLVHYWQLLAKESPMPEFYAFNPSGITDIWSNCITVKLQPSAAGMKPRFQFITIGDTIKRTFAKDLTGEYFTAGVKTFPAARILEKMAKVIESPIPLYDEGQFVSDKNKIIKFRSVLVPLGKEHSVTHIIVGLSWREF